MERYPALQPQAYRGYLVLGAVALVGPPDPDADAVLAPLALHVEGRESADDQLFQRRDIGPYVGSPPLQVQHQIGHPLARPVIGDLAAAAGGDQRKARIEQ